MSQSDINADVFALAGQLPHRGSNTHNERKAATIIRDRMREWAPEADFDEFFSVENGLLVFASAFGEFIFVALLAHWFPLVAFGYGLVVFLMYLLEISGFPTFSLLLPQYETQNVTARFLGSRPRTVVVLTAHYDTCREAPPLRRAEDRLLFWLHVALVCCMFLVLATTAAAAFGLTDDGRYEWLVAVRWCAAGLLGAGALYLVFVASSAPYAQGANDNASGVAALLEVGRLLAASPPPDCDVWLTATGSQCGWLGGMRRLMGRARFDRDMTVFINIDSVGEGELQLVVKEGLLAGMAPRGRFRKEVAQAAAQLEVTTAAHWGRPTDLMLALSRGYDAVGISGAAQDKSETQDEPWQIDSAAVEKAAHAAFELTKTLGRA